MMPELAVKQALAAVLPRLYPDEADFGVELPYGVYQAIGGEDRVYIEGTQMDKANAYIQLRIWADTRLQANQLMEQAKAALLASTAMQCVPMSARVSDKEGDRYGARQDFNVWVSRTP